MRYYFQIAVLISVFFISVIQGLQAQEFRSEELTAGSQIPVTVIYPLKQKIKGNILVLPGWRHSRDRLLKETDLKTEAIRRGYVLILPEMGVTLYESEYYPETTLKWSNVPGRKWILENLLPVLNKKSLFTDKTRNFILGYSTGGRGTALLCLDRPELILGAASISGDFNQASLPNDRLMTAVYGPYSRFKERWTGHDNASFRIKEWKTPLFLSHARDDRIVPFSQSEDFAALIRTHIKNEKLKIPFIFNAVTGGSHDYSNVKTQIIPALNFFDSLTD
jgi:putative tributyrin esterase